jgi:hypothetical protein
MPAVPPPAAPPARVPRSADERPLSLVLEAAEEAVGGAAADGLAELSGPSWDGSMPAYHSVYPSPAVRTPGQEVVQRSMVYDVVSMPPLGSE